MKYYFGIDGGGTKTHCYIGNEEGAVLGEGFGGPANYQICGLDVARHSIQVAVHEALKKTDLSIEDLEYGVLGLSGADEAIDFEVLEPLCKDIFKNIPHKVVNDTWIGLRVGSSHGVISICGTGGAHAGKNRQGEEYILRNLDYILGNRGGGGEIVEHALHFAFRSNEGTYTKSSLETIMPRLFNVDTMDQVCDIIRKDGVPSSVEYAIPIETLKLADAGDEVAVEIIQEMASTEGHYAAAVIKRLNMTEEKVPMILIGSLFKTKNPLIITPFIDAVREVAKNAYVIIPELPPVSGALQLALEANR